MDIPQNKLQTLVERRLNKNRYQTHSATSSIYSTNSSWLNESSSSIEKQLQSLVNDVDTLQDTREVLQQTFDHLKADENQQENGSIHSSLKKPSMSTPLDDRYAGEDETQVFFFFLEKIHSFT